MGSACVRCPAAEPAIRGQVLDLSYNQLSGPLPESWSRMAFLSSLILRRNALTGTLPAAWAAQNQLLQL